MSYPSQKPRATVRMPRMARGQARVSGLLTAASGVFMSRGYDGATMTEIAAVAGASIGSLYQFFPTKPLLAEALHVEVLQALGRALEECGAGMVAGMPTADIAGRLFDTLLDFVTAHPVFVVLAERRDIDPVRKADTRRDMLEQLAGLLARGTPCPTPSRAQALAVLLLTLMKAAVSLRATEGATPATRRLVMELRAMLVAHLAAGG